jgi:hypothetical protein
MPQTLVFTLVKPQDKRLATTETDQNVQPV